jgi:hypothetical protein
MKTGALVVCIDDEIGNGYAGYNVEDAQQPENNCPSYSSLISTS